MKPALHSCIAAILFASYVAFAQTDLCKEENTKAEIFYEMCARFDNKSAGYMDCVNMFMEQKAKAKKICQEAVAPVVPVAPAAPAVSDCEVQKGRAKAIYEMCLYMDRDTDDYDECAEDYKNQNIKAEEACRANPVPVKPKAAPAPRAAVVAQPKPMSLSQALSGSGLSGSCVEDFAEVLGGEGFNMSDFAKDLVTSVAKVKLQLKSPLPFGKPKDGDRTSVGLTVGCIKSLPESPDEIQSLLKNIALKAGLNFVAAAVAAGSYDDESEDDGREKKRTRFGFRAGYNIYNFSFGDSELDQFLETGYGFSAGLTWNIRLANYLRLNMGLDFYYRLLFEGTIHSLNDTDMREIAISIPVLFQIGKSFYVATGIQLDIPFDTYVKLGNFLDGDLLMKNRSSLDFGLVAGLGYMFENIGLDFKFVYGLTSLFEDFTINSLIYSRRSYEDRSSLRQYGLGLSYFF